MELVTVVFHMLLTFKLVSQLAGNEYINIIANVMKYSHYNVIIIKIGSMFSTARYYYVT